MNEHDQERISELSDELDRANEKITCLEADLANLQKLTECNWLIWSHEHNGWWRPNSRGYTPNRNEAGRYAMTEAFAIVNGANAFTGNNPNEALVPDLNWEAVGIVKLKTNEQPTEEFKPKVFKPDAKEAKEAKEANYDPEAVALIRHLKAKGLVLVVFSGERGSGMSVQFTKDAKEIINDVPTFLRRLASRMEFNLIKGNIKGLDK